MGIAYDTGLYTAYHLIRLGLGLWLYPRRPTAGCLSGVKQEVKFGIAMQTGKKRLEFTIYNHIFSICRRWFMCATHLSDYQVNFLTALSLMILSSGHAFSSVHCLMIVVLKS